MRLCLAVSLLSSALLLSSCGSEPVADPTPTPAPTPLPELSLGAATDTIEVTDERSDLAALAAGFATEAAPPTPAPPRASAQQTAYRDPGLGQEGGRSLSASQIKGTVRTYMPQVKACYERQLKSSPGLRGKVVVAWTIGGDGKVRSPQVVSNSTKNRAMLPCIKRTVGKWVFPKAESPSDVEFPFVFRPSEPW